LRTQQIVEHEQGPSLQVGTLNNSHVAAARFVQHPLRNDQLISARQRHLHVACSIGRALPHNRDSLLIEGVKRVIDRCSARNMRIV